MIRDVVWGWSGQAGGLRPGLPNREAVRRYQASKSVTGNKSASGPSGIRTQDLRIMSPLL